MPLTYRYLKLPFNIINVTVGINQRIHKRALTVQKKTNEQMKSPSPTSLGSKLLSNQLPYMEHDGEIKNITQHQMFHFHSY